MLVTTERTVFSVIVLSAVLTGCFHNPPKPTEELKSWFDVQREYAAVLDEQFGKDSVYRVVPVIGPIYRIGSPLRPGTPSLITEACSIEQRLPEQEMGQLPLIKSSKTFGLGLTLPDSIQGVLKGVAEIGARVSVSDSMELNYTNLKHESLTEEDLGRVLKKPKCRDAIKNQNVVLIRGYIRSGLKAISDNSVEIDPKIKFAKIGEFNVKYIDKGGFSIEDLQSRPRFLVITEIQATTKAISDTSSASVLKPVKYEEAKKSERYGVASTSVKHEEKEKESTKKPVKPAGSEKEEIVIEYLRPTNETIKALFSIKTK